MVSCETYDGNVSAKNDRNVSAKKKQCRSTKEKITDAW